MNRHQLLSRVRVLAVLGAAEGEDLGIRDILRRKAPDDDEREFEFRDEQRVYSELRRLIADDLAYGYQRPEERWVRYQITALGLDLLEELRRIVAIREDA